MFATMLNNMDAIYKDTVTKTAKAVRCKRTESNSRPRRNGQTGGAALENVDETTQRLLSNCFNKEDAQQRMQVRGW